MVDGARKDGLERGGSERQPPWSTAPFPIRSLEVDAAVIDMNVSVCY